MADFGKYYRAYRYMQELLQADFTHNYITESLKDGDKGEDALTGKINEKVIDMDWVQAIEEALPYIQKAIDEQRRFIKQIENVVRIERARKTGPESVKHLSQHTNYIAKVEGDAVTPNKLLVAEQEESFAIYENRVLMTLIRRALHFVDDKYSKMKGVPNDSYHHIQVVRHAQLNDKSVDFTVDYVSESHETPADHLDVLNVSELSDFDRVRRIRAVLNDFLNTQLMREIAKESEVRAPITQTNLLKKNPNFKKAMELWNFLDSYKRPGFEIVGEKFEGKMSDAVKQDVYLSMSFQHFMMTLATNVGLRRILEEKYEEENRLIAEENAKPERLRAAAMQARIDEVRKEETEIRIKEIRAREKKILDLTNEVKNLKATLNQKEQQLLALKGQISALQDEAAKLKATLQETKLKLLEAEKENERLKAENAALQAEIVALTGKIDELNSTVAALQEKIALLESENAKQRTEIREKQLMIEQQGETIAMLEKQSVEQLAKITSLTETLERCRAEIAEKAACIGDLTQKNQVLSETLDAERRTHAQTIAKLSREHEATLQKMTDEFEKKAFAAGERHQAEIKRFETKLTDLKKIEAAAAQKRVEAAERAAQKSCNTKLRALNAAHEKELAALKRKLKAELRLVKQNARAQVKLAKNKARKMLFTQEELADTDEND